MIAGVKWNELVRDDRNQTNVSQKNGSRPVGSDKIVPLRLDRVVDNISFIKRNDTSYLIY